MCAGWGLREGHPQPISPQVCKLPAAGLGPQTPGLPYGPLAPKRIPGDLFLVKAGKLAPSPLLASRLDDGHVRLDSKTPHWRLASGPISWRRPSCSWGSMPGLLGHRPSWVRGDSRRLTEAGVGCPPSQLCCIQRETFRLCECKWLLERNVQFLLLLEKS